MILKKDSTHSTLVFHQTLVVSGQRNHEKKTLNTLKAMDPLLSLRTLSTNVHHAEVHLAQFKEGFRDTSRPQTGLQHILVVG